jgi:hypothetical protein
MGEMQGLTGILGRPYLDLTPLLDLGLLDEVHEEVCMGLAQLEVDSTGGSHRSMGIMPPSRRHEAHGDYGEVLRGLSREEFARFASLADEPEDFDPDQQASYRIGEEQDHPLSRQQARYLALRHRVYFPWKVYVELIPNLYWDQKSTGAGKAFTREARVYFPRTLALVRSLPFAEIGRCNIMGLEAHDHGTVHRDGDPATKRYVDHFITLCPSPAKRLFLWSEERQEKTPVTGRAYWFNDSDYHGVEASTVFRYSIRVDGVFRPDFVARMEREFGGTLPPLPARSEPWRPVAP